MSFELPELGYAYDALAPHIDAQTMEIHHSKHHNAYVSKANAALEGTCLAGKSVEQVISNLEELPEEKRNAVRNNAGGHYNHSLFWKTLTPGGAKAPTGALLEAINTAFGSFDEFKQAFDQAAATRFGSGWAWLIVKKDKSVFVASTPNQDCPLMGSIADACGCTPILGLDVWEHAYYLNYQNRRPDYINAFWNVVNWDVVSENYEKG